jgi:hypothetical protein
VVRDLQQALGILGKVDAIAPLEIDCLSRQLGAGPVWLLILEGEGDDVPAHRKRQHIGVECIAQLQQMIGTGILFTADVGDEYPAGRQGFADIAVELR